MDVRPTAPRADTVNSLPNEATPVTDEDARGVEKDTAPVLPFTVVTLLEVILTAPRADITKSFVNEATPVVLEDASGTAKDTAPVNPLKVFT